MQLSPGDSKADWAAKLINKEFKYNNITIRVLDQLGQGAFGVVFRVLVIKPDLTKSFQAAKVYSISHIKQENTMNLIDREFKTLSELNSEFFVKLYAKFTTQNYIFFLMKYYEEGSLHSFITNKNRGLKPKQAIRFLKHLLNGLEELHLKKIIHRDIKPANILMDGDNLIFCDFGFSKILDENSTIPIHSRLGTPFYWAPEVNSGKYSISADIYSLGKTAVFMVSGTENAVKYDWKAESYLAAGDTAELPDREKLASFIISALQPEKNRATIEELKKILESD